MRDDFVAFFAGFAGSVFQSAWKRLRIIVATCGLSQVTGGSVPMFNINPKQ